MIYVNHKQMEMYGWILSTVANYHHNAKLEQLERLRSEDTPLPHDYPYYWVILDPKSKEDKVKVTNSKN